MLGFAQFRHGPIHLGARVEQLVSFQQAAALVALVGARPLEAADGAGAFHVAVGQKALLLGRIPLRLLVGVQAAVLQQAGEHGLRHLEVIAGVGGGEQVVGQPQLLEELQEGGVEAP